MIASEDTLRRLAHLNVPAIVVGQRKDLFELCVRRTLGGRISHVSKRNVVVDNAGAAAHLGFDWPRSTFRHCVTLGRAAR